MVTLSTLTKFHLTIPSKCVFLAATLTIGSCNPLHCSTQAQHRHSTDTTQAQHRHSTGPAQAQYRHSTGTARTLSFRISDLPNCVRLSSPFFVSLSPTFMSLSIFVSVFKDISFGMTSVGQTIYLKYFNLNPNNTNVFRHYLHWCCCFQNFLKLVVKGL